MARVLGQVKEAMLAAAKAGDKAAVAALLPEYRAAKAAASVSQTNAKEVYTPDKGLLDGPAAFASGLVNVKNRAADALARVQDAVDPRAPTLGGLVTGADNSRHAATQAAIDEQTALDKPLLNDTVGKVGRFTGDVVGLAPLGAASGALRGVALLKKALDASKLARIGATAAEGAAGGELSSGDALTGAVTNTGLGGLTGAVGKLVRGRVRTPEAQLLLDKGVDLTPGQMYPKGTWNQIEENMQRLSGLGAPIRNAREDAAGMTRNALVRDATGVQVPGASFEDNLAAAADSFTPRYAAVKRAPIADPGAVGSIKRDWQNMLASPPSPLASNDARNRVGRVLKDQLTSLTPGQTTGDWIEVRSRLRQLARAARANRADPQGADMADMLESAAGSMTQHIEGSLAPTEIAALRAADKDYAKYKVLENANYAAGVRPEGPTFGQLGSALKKTMSSGQWAKGRGGDMRGVTEAGASTFETRHPATGAALMSLAPIAAIAKVAGVPAAMATAAGTAGAVLGGAAVPGIRHAIQGTTAPQRALQDLSQTPVLQDIINRLRGNRLGIAGALTDTQDQ